MRSSQPEADEFYFDSVATLPHSPNIQKARHRAVPLFSTTRFKFFLALVSSTSLIPTTVVVLTHSSSRRHAPTRTLEPRTPPTSKPEGRKSGARHHHRQALRASDACCVCRSSVPPNPNPQPRTRSTSVSVRRCYSTTNAEAYRHNTHTHTHLHIGTDVARAALGPLSA